MTKPKVRKGNFITDFETFIWERYKEEPEIVIQSYLREKCRIKPVFHCIIVDSLYRGLQDRYDRLRDKKMSVEMASGLLMSGVDYKKIKKITTKEMLKGLTLSTSGSRLREEN